MVNDATIRTTPMYIFRRNVYLPRLERMEGVDEMTEHTPLPWKIRTRETPSIDTATWYIETDSALVAEVHSWVSSEANARFIVTACNSHADLLEACCNALGAYQALEILGADKQLPGYEECLSFLRQAIRKAKEQS